MYMVWPQGYKGNICKILHQNVYMNTMNASTMVIMPFLQARKCRDVQTDTCSRHTCSGFEQVSSSSSNHDQGLCPFQNNEDFWNFINEIT